MKDDLDSRLRNWAAYVVWGHVGPEHRTRCASAEGNYESDDVWEGEEPTYTPDLLDGELLENAIRELPNMSRIVLKAYYVSYPYHRAHTVAQRLKISVDRLESELNTARRRLSDRLQRNPTGKPRVANC